MKTSLYQRYLAAYQIANRIESVGATVGGVYIHEDSITLTLGYVGNRWENEGPIGCYSSPERREAAVNEFLTLYPDATITRKPDYYGKPEMILSGVAAHGIEWKVSFEVGVCEKVQVGTKTVERIDPDVYATLPKVEFEEPVYEYRCTDPIAAAGLL